MNKINRFFIVLTFLTLTIIWANYSDAVGPCDEPLSRCIDSTVICLDQTYDVCICVCSLYIDPAPPAEQLKQVIDCLIYDYPNLFRACVAQFGYCLNGQQLKILIYYKSPNQNPECEENGCHCEITVNLCLECVYFGEGRYDWAICGVFASNVDSCIACNSGKCPQQNCNYCCEPPCCEYPPTIFPDPRCTKPCITDSIIVCNND